MDSSIGIIGGADGPTAVFLTAGNKFSLVLALIALTIAVAATLWLWWRSK